MKIKTALLGIACALAAGCGDDENFTLESGTYQVSDANLTSSADQCGLLGAYTDPSKVIDVTVNGTDITFDLAPDPQDPSAAVTMPRATVNGNLIDLASEASYTVAFTDPTCVTRVRRNVVGEMTADNTALLTLSFTVDREAGTCTGDNTAFATVPCTSSYQFTATRQ